MSDAVLPYHAGGKETRHHEVVRRLATSGFDVEIHTMRWWPERGDAYHGGIRYRPLTALWPMYRDGRRCLVQAVMFAIGGFRMLFRRFDVVEVDSVPVVQIFVLRLATWLRRRRLVVTWHEVWGAESWRSYLGPIGSIAAVLERWALTLPDHIVSPSPGTARRIDEMTGGRTPVTVVPNGIDLPAINAVQPAAQRHDLVFVGRLIEHKNVSALLRGLAVLSARGDRITCRIIGTGPQQESLRRQAVELGLDGLVRFDGWVRSDEDVLAALKAARVFVSLSEREGFGISVLEALACGLPVVAYDHPDNHARHLLVDGVTARLVDTLEPAAVAAAIDWTLRHADRLRGPAADSALSYDWDTIAREMEKVYGACES
ncbi:glycosyltransferase family 4 protein [Micromonospora psammae]|uniref:glycosyltransferase family 4 protein n=1 Tax=Micromonospora sp. CPCC 205556 TaxID=3122398 RepID=UPI002FF0AE2A